MSEPQVPPLPENVRDDLLAKAIPSVNRFKKKLLPTVIFVALVVFIGGVIGGHSTWEDWPKALKFGAAAFGVFGSAITLRASIPREETAISMSATRWNGNPDLLANLLKNRIAAKAGLWLIMAGFFLFCIGEAIEVVGE